MEFTEQQIAQLSADLDRGKVKARRQGGMSLSYIEGWWAIHEANRIFGFGGWTSEIKRLDAVTFTTQAEKNYENASGRLGYLISYVAVVRVTVGDQVHEDVGYGEGIDYSNVGQATESAVKEAVTDALKRALKDWGNPFGLALYDKDQRGVSDPDAPPPVEVRKPRAKPYTQQQDDAMALLADLFGADGPAKLQYCRDVLGKQEIRESGEITAADWKKILQAAEGDVASRVAAAMEDTMEGDESRLPI